MGEKLHSVIFSALDLIGSRAETLSSHHLYRTEIQWATKSPELLEWIQTNGPDYRNLKQAGMESIAANTKEKQELYSQVSGSNESEATHSHLSEQDILDGDSQQREEMFDDIREQMMKRWKIFWSTPSNRTSVVNAMFHRDEWATTIVVELIAPKWLNCEIEIHHDRGSFRCGNSNENSIQKVDVWRRGGNHYDPKCNFETTQWMNRSNQPRKGVKRTLHKQGTANRGQKRQRNRAGTTIIINN